MKYIMIVAFAICIVGCNSTKTKNTSSTYSGFLKVQGITTYQYGTHTLETNSGTYALKSNTIILDDFDSENVIITANSVDGYPVDGGPIYLNVLTIELKN